MGITIDQVSELIPQTNHKYIEKRYGIHFASQSPLNKGFCVRGGIQVGLDTKELNNSISLSKDIDLGSNSLQNSDVLISEKIAEQKENAKVIHFKSKPIGNKRKKSTNAQIKANKAKLYRFNQYQEPKSLGNHYPLSQEDCTRLQINSARDFTLNAMNEILLDMSRRPKESQHKFPSKAAFMAYMSKVYRNESRDAIKTEIGRAHV